jgi:hypothetical protein
VQSIWLNVFLTAAVFLLCIVAEWMWYVTCNKKNIQIAFHRWDQLNLTKHSWDLDITVCEPILYHLDWFLRNAPMCGGHLLPLYPNAKEVTESAAAFRQVDKFTQFSTDSSKRNAILVVGDGATCRTGAMFASLGGGHSQVVSIDPALNLRKIENISKVLGSTLSCFKGTIEAWLDQTENCNKLKNSQIDRVIIVAVHSHALFKNYIPQIASILPVSTELVVFAIPCCFSQHLSAKEAEATKLTLKLDELDWGILSDKRRILLWSNN